MTVLDEPISLGPVNDSVSLGPVSESVSLGPVTPSVSLGPVNAPDTSIPTAYPQAGSAPATPQGANALAFSRQQLGRPLTSDESVNALNQVQNASPITPREYAVNQAQQNASNNPLRAGLQGAKAAMAAPIALVSPSAAELVQQEQAVEHPVADTHLNKVAGMIGGAVPAVAGLATGNPAALPLLVGHAGASGAGQARTEASQQRDAGNAVSGGHEGAAALGYAIMDALAMYAGGKTFGLEGGNIASRIGANVGVNAATGGAAQLGKNVIAGQTIDPNRPTMQNVGTAAGEGAIVGGVFGLGHEAMRAAGGNPAPSARSEPQPPQPDIQPVQQNRVPESRALPTELYRNLPGQVDQQIYNPADLARALPAPSAPAKSESSQSPTATIEESGKSPSVTPSAATLQEATKQTSQSVSPEGQPTPAEVGRPQAEIQTSGNRRASQDQVESAAVEGVRPSVSDSTPAPVAGQETPAPAREGNPPAQGLKVSPTLPEQPAERGIQSQPESGTSPTNTQTRDTNPAKMTQEAFRKQLWKEYNDTRSKYESAGGGVAASRKLTARQRSQLVNRRTPDAASVAAENAWKARDRIEKYKTEHRAAVESAIKAGESVPPEVLKDYPDLKGGTARPNETAPAPSDMQAPALAHVTPAAKPDVRPAKAAETTTPVVPSKPDPRAASLRRQAETLAKQVEDKHRPMTQNMTPKRSRDYAARRTEGDKLDRIRKAMIALADARDAGTLPKELEGVRTKAQIETLVAKKKKTNGGYYDAYFELPEYENTSKPAKLLQDMLEPKSPEQKAAIAEREKAKKIEDLEGKVRFVDIPGFFPTPKPTIEKMMQAADVQPGMKVLEPSAGKGDIADAMKAKGANVDTVEYSSPLNDILKAKGHNVVGEDFLKHTGQYDRIVMNPPFEKGQDAAHVMHAWEQLKPGGKIVAVMSEGTFGRSDRKSTEFRQWLNERDGTSEKLPQGSFTGKESFRQTGTATRMVVIEKPSASAVDPKNTPLLRRGPKGTRPGGVALPDIDLSPIARKAREAAHATFAPDGLVDAVRERVQDEFLPLKRLQQRIGKEQRPASDPYLQTELFQSRAADRINKVEDAYVKPVVEKMTRAGISLEQAADYVYALHAKERNTAIAKINPKMPDGGSGMTNAEAAKIIAGAGPKKAAYDAIAERIISLNKQTRQNLLDEGLIDRDTFNEWNKYKNYVPLRTDMEADGFQIKPGVGFNIGGKESKQAMGRSSKADNPIVWSIMQAQEKIVRAEKGKVGQALLAMLQEHPDDSLWKIDEHKTTRAIDPSTGLVREVRDARYRLAENVLEVKSEGKTHTIEFKGEAERLGRVLKRLDTAKSNAVVRGVQKLVRFYASLQTTRNPEFVLPNLIRDIQTAGLNLSAEKSAGMAGRVIKGIPQTAKAMWDLHGDRSAGKSETHTYAREYLAAGGKVDNYALTDFSGQQKQLVNLLKDASPSNARKALLVARRANDFVERVNGSLENSVRLSAYIEARKSGMTAPRAASLAKNLTVNFTRKGTWGSAINTFYVFSNASIQGNARLIKAMATTNKGRAIAASIFAAGAANAFVLPALLGKDEEGRDIYDQIPDHVKERYIIVPLPGTKKYGTVPMPYGYNFLFNAGRLTVDASTGRKTPGGAASSMAMSAADTFNPIGDSASSVGQMLAPTILDPVVQQSENKDWTGRQIVPDQTPFAPPVPDSQLANRGTSQYAKAVAQWLNKVTGGDEVTSGKVDVSPATIDHWVDWAGGGALRFAKKSAELKGRISEGDVPTNALPVLSRFVNEPPSNIDVREFYDAAKAADKAASDLKHYEETGQTEKAQKVRTERAKELAFSKWADDRRVEVSKARRQVDTAITPESRALAKSQMDGLLKEFNRSYRAGTLPPGEAFAAELSELKGKATAFKQKQQRLPSPEAQRLYRLEAIDKQIQQQREFKKAGRLTEGELQKRIDVLLKRAA
jgi:protein-L-isoaspartate O-methyltransferase